MIVVDVNVVVYLLTETPQRELARRVRERDADWLVPPLWRHEMLSVLATLTREEVLDQASAIQVWRKAIALLGSREQQPEMEDALSLAIEHGISAYDAQYVVLAKTIGTRLVSEDRKLRRRLPDRVASMADFSATLPQEDVES
jgi:predicted nucleic acid-binding protein